MFKKINSKESARTHTCKHTLTDSEYGAVPIFGSVKNGFWEIIDMEKKKQVKKQEWKQND